jgi:hypothetical protein
MLPLSVLDLEELALWSVFVPQRQTFLPLEKSGAEAQRRSRALVPRGPAPTMATWVRTSVG